MRTYNTYNSLERKRANTLTIDLGLRRHSDNRLRALAHQIVHGAADVDVTAMLPARFHRNQATPGYRGVRVVESLGKVYKCHYPNRPTASARNVKRSPLHERLTAQGALVLQRGADSSAPGAWKLATEPWWRRFGPPKPYRATINGEAVELYSQGALRKTAPLTQLTALSEAIGYDAPPQSAVTEIK